MPFPLEGDVVREFAHGLEEIVVIEEKQPFLERLLKDELYNVAQRPVVVGKRDDEGRPLVKAEAELGSDDIARVIGRRLLRLGEAPSVRDRLTRLDNLPELGSPEMARAPYF